MPQKPTIDPTDRSMPPLRITNVMPIARMALMATCLTRIDRLPVVRNSGDSSENTSVTTARAMNARSRSTWTSEPRFSASARSSLPGVADAADASGFGRDVGS